MLVYLSGCSPLWLEPFSTGSTTSGSDGQGDAESGGSASSMTGSGAGSTGGAETPTTTSQVEGSASGSGDGTSGGAETSPQTTDSIDTGSTGCGSATEGCSPDELPVCNDGLREPGETCDGPDLGGESCISLGWDDGVLACSAACSFDVSACTGPPMCQYAVQPELPATSYAAPYDCPGGVVMPISGVIDEVTGEITVSSPGKPDNYGPGTYRVRVFDPKGDLSGQCKPFNVVKTTKVLLATAPSLTFPAFDSLLVCGGTAKAYCITKEDGGNPDHWCSGKLIASEL